MNQFIQVGNYFINLANICYVYQQPLQSVSNNPIPVVNVRFISDGQVLTFSGADALQLISLLTIKQ